jgi:predicted transcriptional regulator
MSITLWDNAMSNLDQIENIVFQALAHPMRRAILRIAESNEKGVSYTELIMELSLSTGKLNYHLDQLEGLIEKNVERRYVLTPFGKKALDQLTLIKQEISPEDEKYAKTAALSQKTSLQPAIKAFLLVGIAFSSLIILVWGYITYLAITEGAPLIVYIILPMLIVLGFSLLGSLIYALKKTPSWIKRLERKLLGTG